MLSKFLELLLALFWLWFSASIGLFNVFFSFFNCISFSYIGLRSSLIINFCKNWFRWFWGIDYFLSFFFFFFCKYHSLSLRWASDVLFVFLTHVWLLISLVTSSGNRASSSFLAFFYATVFSKWSVVKLFFQINN